MGFLDRFTKKEDRHISHEKTEPEPEASTDAEIDDDFELPQEDLVKPRGMNFEFLVKPNITPEDQERLRKAVINNSGLIRYYGFSIEFEENFKVGKMRVTVNCVEPLVPVEKSEENDFYKDIKEYFSKWMSEALKTINYKSELYDWTIDKEK